KSKIREGADSFFHYLSRQRPTVYPQIFLNTACPAKAGDDTDWRDKHGYFFCNQEKYYSFLVFPDSF
ncbi:MAG TPA: hypothetical protein VJU78_12975, partial [Chitinophagaceae bacterium]|nr:hypothetical protein [Chitinophagaceae bacterium]